MPVAEQLPTEQGFQIAPLRSKTYYIIPLLSPGMVQVSPKNIAIASTFVLVAVPVTALAAVIAFPAAEVVLNLVWIAVLIGTLGLLLAYYWTAVNLWRTGNKAGATLFLAAPFILASLLASGLPLSDSAAAAYALGRVGLIQTVILAAVALWFGAQVQRTIQEDVLHLPEPAPAPAPSAPVLGGSALFMAGLLWGSLLLFF